MKMLSAQGATEYLVLLAVVLIVALVSVALLGFFPGMASDAQRTQSEMYWESASPIAIVESAAKLHISEDITYPYLRLRNTGVYPIRITGIVGAGGLKTTQFWGSGCGISGQVVNISDYFYLAPGEEKYFGWTVSTCNWELGATAGVSNSYFWVGGASSLCLNSASAPGTLSYKTLGFEYIEYIDGQQITKRQIGKEWIVKCLPAQ